MTIPLTPMLRARGFTEKNLRVLEELSGTGARWEKAKKFVEGIASEPVALSLRQNNWLSGILYDLEQEEWKWRSSA